MNNQADADLEKRRGTKKRSIPGLLLLVLFGLATVFVLSENDDEPVRVEVSEERRQSLLAPPKRPLVTSIPHLYSTKTVSGEAVVDETVGDRAAWLVEFPGAKQRVFAIVAKNTLPATLLPGQRFQVEGQVYQTQGLNSSTMTDLSPVTQLALREADVYVYAKKLTRIP